ncbi:hypothetical protein EST38_g8164, partial [Candolleomyces aberdarensis]
MLMKDLPALVKDHEARVGEIDREIKALVKRRAAHTRFIEEHSPSIAPARQIPADILFSILHASVLKESSPISLPLISRKHPVVVASHVCPEWRKLTLSLPLLWSDIVISIPPRPYAPFKPYRAIREKPLTGDARVLYEEDVVIWEGRIERLKDAITTWIKRSGSCPLGITFAFDECMRDWSPRPPVDPKAESLMAEIISLLTGVSARWKRVNFNLDLERTTSPFLRLLDCPPDELENLEEFHLTFRFRWSSNVDYDSDDDLPMLPDIVRNLKQKPLNPRITLFEAPSLRSLKVDHLWSNISIPVNWGGLTELCLGDCVLIDLIKPSESESSKPNITVVQLFTLLGLCPNLVRFAIDLNLRE